MDWRSCDFFFYKESAGEVSIDGALFCPFLVLHAVHADDHKTELKPEGATVTTSIIGYSGSLQDVGTA